MFQKNRTSLWYMLLLGAAMVLASGQVGRAGFVAVESASLSDLAGGSSLHAGGAHFTNFMINNMVASGGAIAIDPSLITVVAGLDDGAPALNFLLALGAGPGQIVDLDFKFDVHGVGNITTVESLLSGAGGNNGGFVSLSETIFDANNFPGPPLGSVPTSTAQIHNSTMLSPASSWITVSKDLFITGSTRGTAHISSFFQTYQMVPEPSSMALGLFAALGLFGRARGRG